MKDHRYMRLEELFSHCELATCTLSHLQTRKLSIINMYYGDFAANMTKAAHEETDSVHEQNLVGSWCFRAC